MEGSYRTYYNIALGRITISMIHLDGVDYVTMRMTGSFEEGAEEGKDLKTSVTDV